MFIVCVPHDPDGWPLQFIGGNVVTPELKSSPYLHSYVVKVNVEMYSLACYI
jgi:hypothetical protein